VTKKPTKITTEQPTLEVQAAVDTKAIFDGFWICKGSVTDIVKAETEEGARIFYQAINGFPALEAIPCHVNPRHRDVVICSLIKTDNSGEKSFQMSRSTYLGTE
jgi:hypothetical protein